MSSAMDCLRDELQRSLDGSFSSAGCPYYKVAVLILYWAEDDFASPCGDEAQKVVDLFSKDFQYETEVFPIPSCNSQNLLEQRVVNFKCANDSESSLLIVYYSGHGDPDLERGKAVWAANSTGPPTLDWFLIQPTLVRAQADVLLIFDCCYAALAAKARGKGRLELLAAAPGGGTTPIPGPFSFTQHFVDEVRKALNERNGLRVFELSNLIYQHSEQTPVYLNMRSEAENSILLRPLRIDTGSSAAPWDSANMPMSAFSFTISVIEPPSKRTIRQLGEWIKFSAPKTVSAVKVDRIIDFSNSLQEFVFDEDKAGMKGRFVDSLSHTDRNVVISALRDIGEVVAGTRTNLSTPSQVLVTDTSFAPVDAQITGAKVLQDIEERVSRLSRTVWSLISKHPAYQTTFELRNLEKNTVAQQAGISAAARLSLLAQGMIAQAGVDAVYIPPGQINYKRLIKADDQFVTGELGGRQVIVEISMHEKEKLCPDSLKMSLGKIHSLLATSKPDYFRICHYVGFTCEKLNGWYGFVFELPGGCSQPSSLRSRFMKSPRVPLETRYRLAYIVAASLSGIHSVHWVHKSIRPDNILFFNQGRNVMDVQHDEPWLFGFEQTREDAGISSSEVDYRLDRRIYLPPSRWGTPSEKFSYKHDIYALGVLLLEIGLWCSVIQLDKKRFENASKPEKVQTLLLGYAEVDVRHMMGTRYSKIVCACLTGKVKGDQKGTPEFNIQDHVLDELERLTRQECHNVR